MKTTTILAIAAIVAALGAVTSFVSIHQASAAPGLPQHANGLGGLHSNVKAFNQGTMNAINQGTPDNQPCSFVFNCLTHFHP